MEEGGGKEKKSADFLDFQLERCKMQFLKINRWP